MYFRQNNEPQGTSCRIYQRCGYCSDCNPQWVYTGERTEWAPRTSDGNPRAVFLGVVAWVLYYYFFVPEDIYVSILKGYPKTALPINMTLGFVHYVWMFCFAVLYYTCRFLRATWALWTLFGN